MITARVQLKNDICFDVENLTSINVFSDKIASFNPDKVHEIKFSDHFSYTFIGREKIIAVPGAEIIFVEFLAL